MHPGKVNAIKQQIEQLVEQHHNGGVLSAEPYGKIVEQIYKDPVLESKFSESFLSKKITETVRKVAADPTLLDEVINELIEFLENYSLEQTVYVPLSGISIKNPNKEWGLGNVVLVTSTPALHAAVLAGARDVLTANALLPDAAKRSYYKNFVLPVVNEVFAAKVLARYTVVAEPGRARERAEAEARRVVEVLRFYGSVLYEEQWKIRVCLQHEATPRHQWLFALSVQHFSPKFEVRGAVTTLDLNSQFMARVRSYGADKFFALIGKPARTPFEVQLLRAMHWAANAQMQYDNETRLLNLVSALEAILTRDPGYPVTLAIAEGTALLLGSSYEQRVAIKKDLQDIYALRSQLSHGGSKVILDSNIVMVKNYVKRLLLLLVRRADKFQEPTDLFAWIDKVKLS